MATPWRTPKTGRAESIVMTPDRHSAGPSEPKATSSWWTVYATDPEWAHFHEAATKRDQEMRQTSRVWRQQGVNFS